MSIAKGTRAGYDFVVWPDSGLCSSISQILPLPDWLNLLVVSARLPLSKPIQTHQGMRALLDHRRKRMHAAVAAVKVMLHRKRNPVAGTACVAPWAAVPASCGQNCPQGRLDGFQRLKPSTSDSAAYQLTFDYQCGESVYLPARPEHTPGYRQGCLPTQTPRRLGVSALPSAAVEWTFHHGSVPVVCIGRGWDSGADAVDGFE
mmetsp:Transcript_8339/g.23909  ORF Transcript_8339/g.23909 Transcript_8339/m.23909 type:complete len:203 (-) Transcript_8339:804-1412(-)